MDLDGLLELLDVLGTPLPEGSLGLAVPLLPLLRCGVDLCLSSATTATSAERVEQIVG